MGLAVGELWMVQMGRVWNYRCDEYMGRLRRIVEELETFRHRILSPLLKS